ETCITFLSISQPDKNNAGIKWENYKEAFDIFLPMAQKPTKWGKPTPINSLPCEGINSNSKVLRVTSKVSPIINETDQAVGGVLIDRNKNLVHYEVYMNQPMFDYVVENEFYNAAVQAGSNINFPVNSMELKASWRILDPAVDDTSRYYTSKAIIYIPNDATVNADDCIPQSVKERMEVCSEKLVGLVGLHIVYKTPSNPHFTWMTFEQVDNVESTTVNGKTIPASLRNESTKIAYCPDNSRQCNCPEQETSQITRQIPIPEWVSDVNKTVRDSLASANSVWTNYQLIGIQWAQDDSRTGNPILTNLGNTSMETFNQTASSCIGCHAFARSSNPTIYSDFSWVMGRAQIRPIQLPEANGKSLLTYVMRENPYSKWGTWPNDQWNTYNKATPGENPHGDMIRIYVNANALIYYDSISRIGQLPDQPELPVGSIIVKENYRTKPGQVPKPSDLVELTIMYKAVNDQKDEWFWMKARPYGPIDVAGFKIGGCSSCHENWKGNGDGMLSFNFGKRPVVTNVPYKKSDESYSIKEIKKLKEFIAQKD
ncbi:MAG: hypothetical protein AAFQ94_19180, partial [Bacteroidota bacterium]